MLRDKYTQIHFHEHIYVYSHTHTDTLIHEYTELYFRGHTQSRTMCIHTLTQAHTSTHNMHPHIGIQSVTCTCMSIKQSGMLT